MRRIILGVVSSLVASILITAVGNERLGVRRTVVERADYADLNGWYDVKSIVLNRGLLPGRFTDVMIEPFPEGNRGVLIRNVTFGQQTFFPLFSADYEIGFALRETGAPLPFSLKVRYLDNDGQWDVEILEVVCVNGRRTLMPYWEVHVRNGDFTLDTPPDLECRPAA
jgi:hypothetical protein